MRYHSLTHTRTIRIGENSNLVKNCSTTTINGISKSNNYIHPSNLSALNLHAHILYIASQKFTLETKRIIVYEGARCALDNAH